MPRSRISADGDRRAPSHAVGAERRRRGADAPSQPGRPRAAVQGSEGAARRGFERDYLDRAARAPPRQHLARRRRGRHRSQLHPSPRQEVRPRSRPHADARRARARWSLARRVQGRQGQADAEASRQCRRRPSRSTGRRATRRSQQAATAPLDARPQTPHRRLQGLRRLDAVLRWATPHADGGPTQAEIEARDGALRRTATATASSASSARSTTRAAPMRARRGASSATVVQGQGQRRPRHALHVARRTTRSIASRGRGAAAATPRPSSPRSSSRCPRSPSPAPASCCPTSTPA